MIYYPKNRYLAFAIHLLLSGIIFLILAAIIIFIWYPGFLFWSDGGWQGIRLIAGVDFVIGPILTLLVYRLDKPELKKDLLVIALIQVACLAAGTWLVYKERPLALIYANGTFYSMSENSFAFHDLDSQSARSLDDGIPAWVYVDLPTEPQTRSQLLMDQLKDGPIHTKVDLYRPFQQHLAQVFEEAIDLDSVDEVSRAQVTDRGKLYYFNARYSHSYIELDDKSGQVIKLIDRPKPELAVSENK